MEGGRDDQRKNSVTFSLLSPDGDQGYPGALHILVQYRFSDADEIIISYMVNSDADTVVNLTNHSYFNLDGQDQGSICDHWVTLQAHGYTPVKDSGGSPRGDFSG